MPELWPRLSGWLRQLTGDWTFIAAVGSFVIYLFGYLSLRFQLNVLGIAADLNFIDLRYLFEGTRFLVFLALIPPNLAPALLLIALLILGPYVLSRALPESGRIRVVRLLTRPVRPLWDWCRQPRHLLLIGIVFASLVIQIGMRRALSVNNLLVADEVSIIGNPMLCTFRQVGYLYLFGLVIATIVTGCLLMLAGIATIRDVWSRTLGALLAFLFVLQLLLLPINYGTLSATTQPFPVVKDLSGNMPLAREQTAWLIWEGEWSITYFIATESEPSSDRRPLRVLHAKSLISLPKEDVKYIEIINYSNPIQLLLERSCPG